MAVHLTLSLLLRLIPLAVQSAISEEVSQDLPSDCARGILYLRGRYVVPNGGVQYGASCVLRGDPGAEVVGSSGTRILAVGSLRLDGFLAFAGHGSLVSKDGSVTQEVGATAFFQGWHLVALNRYVSLAGNATFVGTGPQAALSGYLGVSILGTSDFIGLTGAAISAAQVTIGGAAGFSDITSEFGAINVGSRAGDSGDDAPTGLPVGSIVQISGSARFERCASRRSGGAISVNASLTGRVDIAGSATFVECSSGVSGGAIAAGSVSISGTAVFDRCSASLGGGAISSGGGASSRSLDITGTAHFARCNATHGSAVASSDRVEISGDVRFSEFHCSPDLGPTGSVLFLQPGSSAYLSGLRFADISCGTAVWAQAASNLTLTRGVFRGIFSQGSSSAAINADVGKHVNVSSTLAQDVQSFLTAQYTSGIYLLNLSLRGCGGARPGLACVDVATRTSGTGAVRGVAFLPGAAAAGAQGAPLALYRGAGTLARRDDDADVAARCLLGTYPTWTVKQERAFSENTSDGGDCSFSQPHGCCILQYNGWGTCQRAKYTAVNECKIPCTCLQSAVHPGQRCSCTSCKTSEARYAHELTCSQCPDGHISVSESSLATNHLRSPGTYTNFTCISCSEAFNTEPDVVLDCAGTTVKVPAGMMVLKEKLALAALERAQASVTCIAGICAFHCTNPAACEKPRTLRLDSRENTMCRPGYDETSPGCSRCIKDYGRLTYDPFACKRCGVPCAEWFYWLGAPLIPYALGMRSACGLGDSGIQNDPERLRRKHHMGVANSILKIFIAFCTLCNVVFQSLQATAHGGTEPWATVIMSFLGRGVGSMSLLSTSHDCLLNDPAAPMWQWLALELAAIAVLLSLTLFAYVLPGHLADLQAADDGGLAELLAPAPAPGGLRGCGRWRRPGAPGAAPGAPPRVRSLGADASGPAPGDSAGGPGPPRASSCPPVQESAGGRGGHCRRRLVRTTVVLGNTALPSLAGGFVRFWPCAQVQRGGGRAFSAYGLDRACGFAVWPSWDRLLLGLAGLWCCLAAGPLYWCWLLGQHRREDLRPETDWKLIGYLTKNYKEGWKWWEVCVLLRKCILCIAVAMTPASYAPESHLRVPLLTIIAALVLQVKIQPFASDFINAVETTTLTVSLVLLLLSSWIIRPSWSQAQWLTQATLAVLLGLVACTSLWLARLFLGAGLRARRPP